MNLSQKLWGVCGLLWSFEAGFAVAQGAWLWFALSVTLMTLYALLVVVSHD